MRLPVAMAVAVALAAAACGAGSGASATAACSTGQLVVWLDTQAGGAAAGSAYYALRFTNLGSACTLRGFPGVSAVDLTGRQVGKAASRDRAVSSRLVALARGATAKAVVQITDVHNFPRSTCRRVKAAGLRVYPPDQTRSKLVPFPFDACAAGPVFLFVRAVQKS